jgi:GSH-dependent disulfide-bond oxidoreductase
VIDLYTWPTPNGHKVHIMLEETGKPYNVIPVNIGEGKQFALDFLKISPNKKMPAIVDHDGPDGTSMALAESGAILIYLGEKTRQFLPKDGPGRYACIQWVMTQMGHIGPTFSQVHHFRNYAVETLPYAIDRFVNEATRLYNVLDKKLGQFGFGGGSYCTVADIATYPWIRPWKAQAQVMDAHPNLKRWFDAIYARPAVTRVCTPLSDRRRKGKMDAKQRELMFGKTKYEKR